jgi:ABC-type multidrug transport system fused ATPase/permease subunit
MPQVNIVTQKFAKGALVKKIHMSLNLTQQVLSEMCGISEQEVTLNKNQINIRIKRWLASSEGMLMMGIVITILGLLLISWHKEWVVGFILPLIVAPMLLYQAGRKAVSEEINRESLKKHFEELADMVHKILYEIDKCYSSSDDKELASKLTTRLKRNLEHIQREVEDIDNNRMQKFLIPHLEAVSTIIRNYGLEKAITDYPLEVVDVLYDQDWIPTVGAGDCPNFIGTCPFCEKMV